MTILKDTEAEISVANGLLKTLPQYCEGTNCEERPTHITTVNDWPQYLCESCANEAIRELD